MRSFRKRIAKLLIIVMLVSLQVSLGNGGVKAVSSVYKFDFGPTTVAAPAGFTKHGMGLYNAAIGYGWLTNANMTERDRGITGNNANFEQALVDFVFGIPNTVTVNYGRLFQVDLPNGDYYVKIIQGDTGAYAHPNMKIERQVGAEVTPIATVSTVGNTWKVTVAHVSVSDGILQLKFSSEVGSQNWNLNTLEISQNPFNDLQALNLSIADVNNYHVNTPISGKNRFYAYAHLKNLSSSSRSACVVIALYDNTDKLQKVAFKDFTLAGNEERTIGGTDAVTVWQTAQAGWKAKAFVWDSMSSIVPASASYTFQ